MLKNFLNRLTTHEGGKAHALTLDEQILRLFTMGQLNGSFYLDTDTVVKASAELLATALEKRPEFASQAAVYAAEQLGMKALPTLWAVYLSTLPDKTLVRQVFPRVISNPKLAHDFLTLARKGGIRQGMGQGVKRVVNRWLSEKLNPVWATRYAGKLEDLVRVTRPKDTPETKALLQYILRPAIVEDGQFKGYGARRLTFARAQALADVLACLEAEQVTEATLTKIRQEKLQLEELKHAFGSLGAADKQAIFTEMIPGLFYAALVATVADRLRDVAAYRRSRMLPFGLMTAAEMTSVPEWGAAISEVLEALGADSGLGDLPGVRMVIGTDCSGSMDALLTRTLSARTVATTFAAMAARLLDNAKRIASRTVPQYTYLGELLKAYGGEDVVLLITDSQTADNPEDLWAQLRNRPKGARLIVWDVVAYQNKISNRPDVFFVSGFSDWVLGLVRSLIAGDATQMEAVRAMKL